jgi:hypothetical protein
MVSAKVVAGNKTTNVYSYDGWQKFDASLCLGISYKFNDNLDLAFRVAVGLTKMMEGMDNRNNVGQLGMGYRF